MFSIRLGTVGTIIRGTQYIKYIRICTDGSATVSRLFLHFIFISFYYFLLLFSIVVQVQLSPCSCHHFPHPIHHCLPPSILQPFGFVHVFFIHVPWWPFPLFPHYPLHLPHSYCPFVPNLNISGYILLACFVGEVPLTGEIIWHLSFTTWLVSLSIMLYRSTHAVAKGRSSVLHSAS